MLLYPNLGVCIHLPYPVQVNAKGPLPVPLPERVEKFYEVDLLKWAPEQRAELFKHYIRTDPEMEKKIRLSAAQDIAWALINSPAFLFNR